MRILITGSRIFEDMVKMNMILDNYLEQEGLSASQVTIVHGGARGADSLSTIWANSRGASLEKHPADWSQGRAAGLMRNQDMLDTGVDVVIAFPEGEARGTKHMMRIAREAGVQVVEVE